MGERTRTAPAGGARQAAIRPLTPDDAPAAWALLLEFTAYERLTHLATGTPRQLAAHLRGEAWPAVDGFLAELGGEPVGYALYFGAFSSFATAPLLWLEDLYVRPAHRGRGLGLRLLAAVARAAQARGCTRLGWAVLDWNESALAFYRRLGAVRQWGWQVYELAGEPLRVLAGPAAGAPHVR